VSRLLIVGPPGAGKGTQAARISEHLAIPTISTGDIFRQDNGDYVPDELTNALVKDRLEQADADGGFLLDGYPRTPDQVAYLDGFLASHGHVLDAVLQLVADPEELIRRLRQRAGEQGRADDSEEAIRHRQAVYQRETQPLVEIFRERELLVRVDGLGTVDEVWERIRGALALRGLEASAA
jgi:adenylate kinase